VDQAFSNSKLYRELNMQTNLTQHPCADKCTDFKEEQCKNCLVQQPELTIGQVIDEAFMEVFGEDGE